MQSKTRAEPPEVRARRDQVMRLKRFATQFDRWCRGEPVRSYETKWLAYLKERQSQRSCEAGL